MHCLLAHFSVWHAVDLEAESLVTSANGFEEREGRESTELGEAVLLVGQPWVVYLHFVLASLQVRSQRAKVACEVQLLVSLAHVEHLLILFLLFLRELTQHQLLVDQRCEDFEGIHRAVLLGALLAQPCALSQHQALHHHTALEAQSVSQVLSAVNKDLLEFVDWHQLELRLREASEDGAAVVLCLGPLQLLKSHGRSAKLVEVGRLRSWHSRQCFELCLHVVEP